MIHSLALRKRSLLLLAVLSLVGSVLLAACDGTAFINVDYDPTEGVGNIVITGNQDDQPSQQPDQDTSMSQLLLFGLVIALLLGTIAIVMSVARRPR
jgi:hypothetical protein